MRRKIGELAPDFTASAHGSAPITLSSLRGRPVWLAFFRYSGCPLCNLRVHDIVGRLPSWSASGLQVLAVFQASERDIEKDVAGHGAPFPILCDAEETVYRLYGLESSLAGFLSPRNLGPGAVAMAKGFLPGRMRGTRTRLPADFLIDRDGVIRDLFYADVIAAHIPFERVDAFVLAAGGVG